MRAVVVFLLMMLCVKMGNSQTKAMTSAFVSAKRLEAFPLSSVRLLDSRFKQAQDTDLKYMLSLDPDRLLVPFLREAGIKTSARSYPNWENTGLDGHIGGHYLSALANMYAATGNKDVYRRLQYMVDWLDSCQRKSGGGYVSGVPNGKAMWQEIAKGKIDAGSFSLNNRWVPLYNIHKTYAALRDAHVIAGIPKAKKVFLSLCDWFLQLTANLTDAQIQEMLRSEHGGMNEVFADAAALTGDQKYLQIARKLSHQHILKPLLSKKDSLTGLHANTQIPKVIGFERIAEVAGDKSWEDAAKFFWRTVVDNRTISIGGNSVREHFHPAEDFSSMLETREGPETCNSYNMLRLTKNLFLSNPEASYLDYYERALYNHILSSQHPNGGFVYFTPIRPRHYRVYSQEEQGFWCCVGSGLENHGKYGELIYSHSANDIYVNLFIPSVLNWKEKDLELVQNTSFPYSTKSSLTLKLKAPKRFAVNIRYPSWVSGGALKVTVNNKEWPVKPDTLGYVAVNRLWKSGDVVSLTLPMHIKTENLPDRSSWISFLYGPIVLAAATDTTDLVGLRADSSRMGHIANGPLYPIDEAPMVVTSASPLAKEVKPIKGEPLHFTAKTLIYPAQYQNLVLKPFYEVHDARYMLYWRSTDKAGFGRIQEELKEKEKKQLALEAITLDKVAPGEQQPESDHSFQGEKTETGAVNDKHWRRATGGGWFQYTLKNKNNAAKKIRVTYFGRERNEGFDIYLNDQLLKKVTLDGSGGNALIDVDYEIPAEHRSQFTHDRLTIRFSAPAGSSTARIVHVRLLSH